MAYTLEQRVTDLEADVKRLEHRQQRTDEDITHLTVAAGDLSQNQRELKLDVQEIRTDVAEIKTDVGWIKEQLGILVDAVQQLLDQRPSP